MKALTFLASVCIFVIATQASANCANDDFGRTFCSKVPGGAIMKNDFNQLICGPGQCVSDAFNRQTCSKFPGGVVVEDTFNRIFSAPGPCLADSFGQLTCSAIANGAVIKDDFGRIKCEGGCVKPVLETVFASADQCYLLSN